MAEVFLKVPSLIGRSAEMETLRHSLDGMLGGKGSMVIVSGEPGIGKTRLVAEFCARAREGGALVLTGAARSDSAQPFHVFMKALEGRTDVQLFSEREQVSFSQVFAINRAGILVAKAASSEGDLDADIFAGMLSAVQSFVRDSFDSSGQTASGLGRLEYGDLKILIENGEHLFLTAVISGSEHPDMKFALRSTLRGMEQEHGEVLRNWTGRTAEVRDIQQEVENVAGQHFIVRKNLEGLKPEDELLKAADIFLELLDNVAGSEPQVLLLEDLHWADESSLAVLNHIARNVRERRMLLLATCRPDESPSLEKTLGAMEKNELISRITLDKLGPASVSSIVDDVCPDNRFPQEFIDALIGRCDGTPLFVIELLRHMVTEGSIGLSEGAHVLVRDDYAIPDTVEEVIQNRLSRLGPNAFAMAECASCIGREFAVGWAMSIANVRDPADALSELRDSGVVLIHDGEAEFSHAMYQEAIYSAISPRWRSNFHRGIGEHIEATCPADEFVYELARHFSLTGEFSKAADYCVQAGEKAEAGYATDLAIQFYDTALSLGPKAKGAMTKEKAADLHERLGDLHTLGGNYDKAIESYGNALAAWPEPGDKCRIHRKRSMALEKQGKFDDAVNEMDVAQGLVAPESPEHWRCLAQKGYILIRKNDYDKAIGLCGKARAEFERMGLEVDVANADKLLGSAYWYKQDFESSIMHLERSAPVMAMHGDEIGLLQCYNSLGNSLDSMGRPEQSLEYYNKALEIAERRRDQHSIGMLYNNLGLVHGSLNNMDKALEYEEKSLAIRLRIGDIWGQVASYSNLGQVVRRMGDAQRALELFTKSNEMAKKAQILPFILGSGLTMAEILTEKGRLDDAEPVLAESEALATQSGAKGFIAFAAGVRGKLLWARKDYENARQKFEEGASIFDSIKMPVQVADLRFDLGQVLMEAGQVEKGRDVLRQAMRIYEESGIEDKVRDCKLLLGE